jgi:hypothetical protein
MLSSVYLFINVQDKDIQYKYSETCLNQPFCLEKTGVHFIQVKSTTISFIRNLFYVRFIQDSGLFKVWFRQVFMFAVCRILVYSRFGLDRFLCSLYAGFWFIQGLA